MISRRRHIHVWGGWKHIGMRTARRCNTCPAIQNYQSWMNHA